MRPRQIDVFGMRKKDITKLKMGACFDSWRWFKIEDRL